MLAYWCLSQNFGDRLTYWLVEKITGAPPRWVSADDERPHLLGVGSILNQAGPSSVVWGAGFASIDHDVKPAGVSIRLTRGPLSAWRARRCGCAVPRLYGDPALLCPRFHQARPKQHKLGVVYHYIDQAHWPEVQGAVHINVLADPEAVIDAISECEAIVSSSLHGLIVADAYGIPAGWLESPRVGGDGTKFADHILAVGGTWTHPLAWPEIEGRTAGQIVAMIPPRRVSFDADAILGAFPMELARPAKDEERVPDDVLPER